MHSTATARRRSRPLPCATVDTSAEAKGATAAAACGLHPLLVDRRVRSLPRPARRGLSKAKERLDLE
jgi:hypothetical protein